MGNVVAVHAQMVKKWQKATGHKDNRGFDTNHVYAALTILDSFRTYRFRKYAPQSCGSLGSKPGIPPENGLGCHNDFPVSRLDIRLSQTLVVQTECLWFLAWCVDGQIAMANLTFAVCRHLAQVCGVPEDDDYTSPPTRTTSNENLVTQLKRSRGSQRASRASARHLSPHVGAGVGTGAASPTGRAAEQSATQHPATIAANFMNSSWRV